MILIGLTGGIASGKSTVSQMFAELGAAVIDADKVGHEVLQYHVEARNELVKAFGSGILSSDGEINRGKIADIVFNDHESLKQLNQILHPVIYRMMEERVEYLRSNGVEVAIMEAAVLIEANWAGLVDQVWVTLASEDTVINRLCANKGFTEKQARARINSQMPIDQRATYADVVINTDCDLSAVRAQVNSIWQKFQAQKHIEQ
ncbi:dephospho-CoA kinase [Chloroflexota bacterium]